MYHHFLVLRLALTSVDVGKVETSLRHPENTIPYRSPSAIENTFDRSIESSSLDPLKTCLFHKMS